MENSNLQNYEKKWFLKIKSDFSLPNQHHRIGGVDAEMEMGWWCRLVIMTVRCETK